MPNIYPDLLRESSTMSLSYINQVLDILGKNTPLRSTATGIAKQTGITAIGCAAGGVLMGPVGALVGGCVGSYFAYQYSDDYESLITVIRMLGDREKEELGRKVQTLVGAVTIEEFVRWIQNEEHRTLLLGVLSEFARQAQKA